MAQLYPRILAQLQQLELLGLQDRVESLDEETSLELYLNKPDHRSYVVLKPAAEKLDTYGLGNSELWMYESADAAGFAYDQMLREARQSQLERAG